MRYTLLIMVLCLSLAACSAAEEPDVPTNIVSLQDDMDYVTEEFTVYNDYLGLAVTLPGDTRLSELENLGQEPGSYTDEAEMSRTHYGEGTTVYTLVDMILDRGGDPNYCQVYMAAEAVEGIDTLADYAVLSSQRLVLSSDEEPYTIIFEGGRDVIMGGEPYYLMTFTEYEDMADEHIYEVYVKPIGDLFFTVVLYYNVEESSVPGMAVGQSYVESCIRFIQSEA